MASSGKYRGNAGTKIRQLSGSVPLRKEVVELGGEKQGPHVCIAKKRWQTVGLKTPVSNHQR